MKVNKTSQYWAVEKQKHTHAGKPIGSWHEFGSAQYADEATARQSLAMLRAEEKALREQFPSGSDLETFRLVKVTHEVVEE